MDKSGVVTDRVSDKAKAVDTLYTGFRKDFQPVKALPAALLVVLVLLAVNPVMFALLNL